MATLPLDAASQPQIIRAHQKDLFNLFALREETENVLRSWLGTRWLTRWEKEADLFTKLVYHALTTLRGGQTLGEEYTDIRQITQNDRLPSLKLRAFLIALSTLPPYLVARFSRHLPRDGSLSARFFKALPYLLEAVGEVNLAFFYLRGTYYTLVNRILRVRHISSTALDPRVKPPSYSLLGILLSIRLLHRLYTLLSPFLPSLSLSRQSSTSTESVKTPKVDLALTTTIDSTPVSSLLGISSSTQPQIDDDDLKAHWGDRTVLSVDTLYSQHPPLPIGTRKCALCLEERTASAVTECGHVFCWACVIGWGREKPECPLCRQSLDLAKVLPLYNL